MLRTDRAPRDCSDDRHNIITVFAGSCTAIALGWRSLIFKPICQNIDRLTQKNDLDSRLAEIDPLQGRSVGVKIESQHQRG